MSMRTTAMPPYTYADLTDLTRIPYGTLRQWVNRGKMPKPTGRVGSSPVWDRLALEDWLTTHEATA